MPLVLHLGGLMVVMGMTFLIGRGAWHAWHRLPWQLLTCGCLVMTPILLALLMLYGRVVLFMLVATGPLGGIIALLLPLGVLWAYVPPDPTGASPQ